tara:strand:+ start:368 stop:583 length:216 start_codon:yes stop_codon:yes gene_type:complete
MSTDISSWLDTKLFIWVVGMIFFAGGGWMSLDNLGLRVIKLEMSQEGVREDISIILQNQARMCQSMNINCD